jgi:hypothetical protein
MAHKIAESSFWTRPDPSHRTMDLFSISHQESQFNFHFRDSIENSRLKPRSATFRSLQPSPRQNRPDSGRFTFGFIAPLEKRATQLVDGAAKQLEPHLPFNSPQKTKSEVSDLAFVEKSLRVRLSRFP